MKLIHFFRFFLLFFFSVWLKLYRIVFKFVVSLCGLTLIWFSHFFRIALNKLQRTSATGCFAHTCDNEWLQYADSVEALNAPTKTLTNVTNSSRVTTQSLIISLLFLIKIMLLMMSCAHKTELFGFHTKYCIIHCTENEFFFFNGFFGRALPPRKGARRRTVSHKF